MTGLWRPDFAAFGGHPLGDLVRRRRLNVVGRTRVESVLRSQELAVPRFALLASFSNKEGIETKGSLPLFFRGWLLQVRAWQEDKSHDHWWG